MDFSAYQQAASETSQLRLGGPQGVIAPMLGLAGETGSILSVYKKYLRDGIDLAASREFLREELGDLLWYAAAVATACGLDLEDVAQANLRRTRDRYRREQAGGDRGGVPVFDAGFPARERFPRRLVVAVTERVLAPGRRAAFLTLVSAEPNAFPEGPVTVDGKPHGFQVGAELGDPLTDNSRRMDAYRFHDAIHLGFMAVLGWSPLIRALLRLKRKSSSEADECEDGARAIFAEEGLAAVLSRLAPRRTGFSSRASIDGDVIEVAKAAVTLSSALTHSSNWGAWVRLARYRQERRTSAKGTVRSSTSHSTMASRSD
jgi:NTP pyrophosphatase (non-canonical NTP hydrolase)